jgi:hypothetical protein
LLIKLLRKDAFAACCDADEEPLLVYIVDVPRVNVILSDFRVEEVEIRLIAIFSICLVTFAINSGGVFRGKSVVMSFEKPRNLLVRNLPLRQRRGDFFVLWIS